MTEQAPVIRQEAMVIPQEVLAIPHAYLPIGEEYAFMAQQNQEQGIAINQEISTELANDAKTLLASSLSGTEVADRIGRLTIVEQRADKLLYDMGKDIPGRETPLVEPAQEWDFNEYMNAKYAVIADMQRELNDRNETYHQLTNAILEDDLSYRDVLGEEAVRAGTGSEHPEHADAYAHELARFVIAGKGEEVQQAAQEIRRRFEIMRSWLPKSLELSPYADSRSWILWDIGKQEALKDKEYESSADLKSEDNPQLVGDTPAKYSGSAIENQDIQVGEKQTNFMRNVIAWRHLGWEMHLKASRGEDTSWLDPLLNDQMRNALHKIGDAAHSGQLSSSEYTDLGRSIEAAIRTDYRQREATGEISQETSEARSKDLLAKTATTFKR